MKNEKLLFPLLALIAFITYYPTIGAGFVYDFPGWQRHYDEGSFADILNSFGYKGHHQVLHFFFFSIYKLFHLNGLPWYIIFTALQAFNGWLLYKWLTVISARWSISFPPLLIILLSILFVIHPYSVEAVVWKVCVHYLLSLAAILGLLLVLPKYIDTGSRKYLLWSMLIYGASLFVLELSYITPALITMWLIMDAWVNKKIRFQLKSSLLVAFSLFGLLAGNLLLNRLTLGAWVGHYGAETHLKFDLIGIVSTELKYLIKHLVDARYYSFKAKTVLFDQVLSNPLVSFAFLTVCLSLVILYIIKARRLSGRWHLFAFGMVASMLYTLPVANLFFFHLHVGMNDRLSYVPLLFLWVAIGAALSKTSKTFYLPFMTIMLLLHLYLQEKTVRYWKESTDVLVGLKASFRWHDKSHVFVLNSPDNLNGIVMVSIINAPSGFDELLDYQTDRPYTGEMYDVYQYNMTTPNDGVTVEQTGPMQLKVTFKQWGNWWHRNGIGAGSYENEYYKAETLDYPYQLTFKQLPENSAIIYQDGKTWKEFEMIVERVK